MDEETLKAIENYRGFGKRDSLVIGFQDGKNGSPKALMLKNEFPRSTTNLSVKKARYQFKKESLSRSTTNLLMSQRPITAQQR